MSTYAIMSKLHNNGMVYATASNYDDAVQLEIKLCPYGFRNGEFTIHKLTANERLVTKTNKYGVEIEYLVADEI